MDTTDVVSKLSQLSLQKQEEVIDFIDFLYKKEMQKDAEPNKKRVAGLLKGKIKILPGFDDPIEGMEKYYQ